VQGFPKLGNKKLVPVANDVERETILAVPQVEKLCSKPFRGDVRVRQCNANICAQTVGDSDYAVVPFIHRQRSNEINGY
jgi:hypothetical protein